MHPNSSTALNVVIVGGSGHGSVIADAINASQHAGREELRVVGFVDNTLPVDKPVNGLRIIGRLADLPDLMARHGVGGAVIGIGDNWTRAAVVQELRALAPTLQFPCVVHPSAQLAGRVQLGEGSVVLAGVVVNYGATVGDFCILNTCSSLDHDSRLGNYVSLAPRACTGGNVEVGDYSAICLGANVIHGIRIGCHCVVGAGATVLDNLPCEVVAYGTPARVVRRRAPGENYLGHATRTAAGPDDGI